MSKGKILRGLKRYGHRSHVSGGRILKSLAQSGYFDARVKREQEVYLSK